MRYYILHYSCYILRWKVAAFRVDNLLHFALILLHFALVLQFAAIVVTFCIGISFSGNYYILRCNSDA